MRVFSALLASGLLLLSVSLAKAEGTYGNIGTTSSNNGGFDAVSWSQGYPLVIDSYGNYLVPIQPHGNTNYNIAFSNDGGVTWSEQDLPSDEEFANRSSVAYDSINDKLHVIETTNDAVVYKRYLIFRDESYNIYSIKEDPTLTPLVLDNLGSCSTDSYGNPVALFKDEGTNGMIVAFWSLTKTGCGGQSITETRASFRLLSNSSADGTAGNWEALNNSSDIGSGVGPAVVDYNILYTDNSVVGIRQQSAMIRGSSGVKSEDIYYFNVDATDTNGFTRLAWNDADGRWSGTWTSRITFGGSIGSDNGYNLKQELLTKPIYAEAHNKVYVGIARWLDGVNGDTQSLFAVDSSDSVSLISNVYSAGGSHCLYPTLDIAYDSVEEKLYTFYDISGAASVCGNVYYKTYDGSTISSAQPYYTVSNRSVDIPVTYPTRYDNKILLFYRLNSAVDHNTPPHDIDFGYISLDPVTPTNIQTLSSGTYEATSYTDFEKACVTKNTAQIIDRSGGEIILASSIADDFGVPLAPYPLVFLDTWIPGLWSGGAFYPEPDGTLTLTGLPTSLNYSRDAKSRKILEFRARFTANNFQHIGFSDEFNFNRYVMFSTGSNGILRTRVVDGGSESATVLGTDNLGAYHTYKIDWQTNNARFYVDDVLVDTITTNVPTAALNVMTSNSANSSGADLLIDWIHLYDYPDTTGTYTSCILDSGAADSEWGTLNYSAITPASTTVAVSTRTSDDAITWSSYSSAISDGGDIPSSDARYLQYKVDFEGTSTTAPQLESISLAYATPAPTPTPTPTPSPSSNSGSSSGSTNSSSGTSSASCTDAQPQAAQLYAILPESQKLTKLYFTDQGKDYTEMVVRYGKEDGQFTFGTQQAISLGTRTLLINELEPGATYFFQVRYQNGCTAGDWSNTMSVTMPSSNAHTSLLVSDITSQKDENQEQDRDSSAQVKDDEDDNQTMPDSYTVKVKLTDANGGAVAGAKVIMHSEPKETTSDENGIAEFKDVEPGEHTLIVESEELSGEQKVTIGGQDPNLIVTVTLRPDPWRSWLLVGGGILAGLLLFGGGFLLYRKLDD